MLAIVKSARSIRGPLRYNEEKVKLEQARLLEAHNFLQEIVELTMRDKLQCFQKLAALNERSEKKAVHISVNFSEADVLTDKQMIRIADGFMHGIGFADQPWLAYRHIDAGHPHLHIVTTNIRPDGSRILNDLRSPHNLKQLCHDLERLHGLTHAISLREPKERDLPRDMQRLTYGEKPTKTGIGEVLDYVNQKYTFTSFEAYNAVLSLYHVRADRGKESSPMYQNKGLYYRMIDQEGKKLGAPIKASAFDLPVTLAQLEKKFELNRERLQRASNYVSVYIDLTLDRHDIDMDTLRREMAQRGVEMVIPALTQRNTRGQRPPAPTTKIDDGHGIFYVDFTHMAVVRDTDLGKNYTAAALLERTGLEKELRQLVAQKQLQLTRPADRAALQPGYPDPAETRRVLLNYPFSKRRSITKEANKNSWNVTGNKPVIVAGDFFVRPKRCSSRKPRQLMQRHRVIHLPILDDDLNLADIADMM